MPTLKVSNGHQVFGGLSSTEVERRQVKYGPNELPRGKSFSAFKILLSQFKSPLIYVLLGAMAVTLALQDYVDSVVIGLAVMINTALGFWQEYKAERSLEELSAVLTPTTVVMRDGERQEIEVKELVPGDVVLLDAGELVPADGVVVESQSMSMNEALLTGESVPVAKKALKMKKDLEDKERWGKVQAGFVNAEERDHKGMNSIYAGTTVSAGSGTMVVVLIGEQSEMGKIAQQLKTAEDEDTPLQKKLKRFSNRLAVIVVALSVVIFVAGYLAGNEFVEMFTLSVAVAVSAIPEGLVVSLTAILAIGMQRILRREALVRKLVAAEVLGSVSVICSDKTGTLTEGKMRVKRAELLDENLGVTAGLMSSDLKDPMEVAMYEWASSQLGERQVEKVQEDYTRIDRIPFASEKKFSATLTERELFVVGAPEVLMSRCRISQKERNKWEKNIIEEAKKGYRLVGLAHRKRFSENKVSKELLEKQWHWLGYVVYEDRIRSGIKPVLKEAEGAGIGVKVITGDYRETALEVMKELGLKVKENEVMDGAELSDIAEHELDSKISEIVLFARTTPGQKLKIVESLQRQERVVAMTGDGVNDAPALKKADIGVVVSSASDVSKETADMVLLNDDFGTIIAAVEEGRGIFTNLRKVVLYLMSDSFTEVLLVMGSLVISLMSGYPLVLPITAAQILWVNLANDGLPSLALTMEPKEKGLLKQQPRGLDEPIIDREIAVLIGLISLTTGLLVLIGFWWQLLKGADLVMAQTFAFTMLGVDSLLYVFSSRSLSTPIWRDNFFKNPYLIGAVLVGFCIQLAAVYLPVLQRLLGTVALGLESWVIIGIFSLVVMTVIESVKAIFLHKKHRIVHTA